MTPGWAMYLICMELGDYPRWDSEKRAWTVPGRKAGDPAESGLYAPGTTKAQVTAGWLLCWLDKHAPSGV